MISSQNILSNRKTDTWLDKIDCYVDWEESVKWGKMDYLSRIVKGVMVNKNSEKAVQITLFQMVI